MNLKELTDTHAPHPLSEAIQARQAVGGGNANVIAQGIALRTCPASELPAGLREARKKIDEAQTQKDAAERELNARLADWQRYRSLLSQIGESNKDLAFAQSMLAATKAAAAGLPQNFLNVKALAHGTAWQGALELVRDAMLCREVAKLLPDWIEAETAAIAELEAQAAELEKRYGE